MNDTTLTLDQRLAALDAQHETTERRILKDIEDHVLYQRRYLDKLIDNYNDERAQMVADDFREHPESWTQVQSWNKPDYVGHPDRLRDEIARAQQTSNWTPQQYHLYILDSEEAVTLYRKAVQS